MFYIFCPYCGEHREEEEFHPKGQAHLARPADPENTSDDEWGDYLFFRDNPRGVHHELWVHAVGCRKFFNITRHTVSYEILEVYKMGEQPSITADSYAAQQAAASGTSADNERNASQGKHQQGVRA